jgi:sulfoxide reductase heme-binding subunit YedZ
VTVWAVAVAASPKALWFLTRGTGVVALILLTTTVALGVANVRRTQSSTVPRFVVEAVHRSASLLAVAFLVIHIGTAELDTYAPIRLVDAVVPFTSTYRPLWLGLGAVAFDLLLAVSITSLLRRHLGYRAWRVTHWAAYISWPVALLHGLGTGSDAKAGWMLAITAGCVIVVIVAVVARASQGWPEAGWPNHAGARAAAIVLSVVIPIGLLVWLPGGPLAAGWAERAGTPSTLLASRTMVSPAAPATASTSFTGQATGIEREGHLDEGVAQIHLVLSLPGHTLSTLGIRIFGQPARGGGLEMSSSRVELGTVSDPRMYLGQVTSLDGPDISALVTNSSGQRLQIVAQLQIAPGNGVVSGTASVRPA